MKTKSTIAVLSTAFLILGIVANSVADETEKTVRFQGTYCDGAGDVAWLQLIDERAVMLPRSGQGTEADANVAWGGVPIDNESNLLKNHVTRVTTDGNMLFGSSLKNINDGKLISNGDIAESTANLSVFSAGSHVVFQLDATYLIDRIDIFTVHAHPFGFTMWMAGGGVRGGMTYGATDEFGWHSIENKVHVHDLHATILQLMGLDHERLTFRFGGRDYRLTDVHGHVVKEILA